MLVENYTIIFMMHKQIKQCQVIISSILKATIFVYLKGSAAFKKRRRIIWCSGLETELLGEYCQQVGAL